MILYYIMLYYFMLYYNMYYIYIYVLFIMNSYDCCLMLWRHLLRRKKGGGVIVIPRDGEAPGSCGGPAPISDPRTLGDPQNAWFTLW